jgi:4-hydroxy-2-oxoheptanedioate aldolase
MPDTPVRSLNFPSLNRALRAGETVLGCFCELPCPESVELIGLAGWDFVVLDCEHAPITAPQLPGLVRAAAAAGIPAVVRVAGNDAPAIQHALDSGAAGVQIPQVASLEEARAAIAASRFHPIGRRGLNPFVRAADFSSLGVHELLERSNHEVALVLQIESAEGIAAIDAIVELPGIDAIFIGPYDLSQSLGTPGDTAHPHVYAAGERIVRQASAKGIAVGCFTNSAEEARRWLELGVRYLCYSVDTVLLLKALRGAASSIRAFCPPR